MAHDGRWDHLRRNVGVVYKPVGMGGHRFRHLPRHSAFGFRRSNDAGVGRDQLVLEGAEGDRGRVIRIRVCGAGRSCKSAQFPSTGEGLLDTADRRQHYNREDNERAIKMATTNRLSSRHTRNVGVKHHTVRDAVESGIVRIHYVKSGEQHADVLTKALDVNTFETHARFSKHAGRIDDGLG